MAISSEIFDYFSKLIYDNTGIVYNEKNKFALSNRLEKISKDLEFDDPGSLYTAVKGGCPQETMDYILEVATNHETLFFRDRNVFDALKNHVVDPWLADGKKMIKVLSLACSTGQEPYSVAMIFEDLKGKYPNFNYSILASDISEPALKVAEAGVYSQLEVQRGLPVPLLVKYFDQSKDKVSGAPGTWEVKEALRKNISFKPLNLIEPKDFKGLGVFDLVLCRNVLIYHDQDNRQKIIQQILNVLAPKGLLILGTAERVHDMDKVLRTQLIEKACFYSARAAEGDNDVAVKNAVGA